MLTVVNTLSNISYEALLKYAIFLTLTGAFVIIVWQHLEKEKPMVKSHYANKEKKRLRNSNRKPYRKKKS